MFLLLKWNPHLDNSWVRSTPLGPSHIYYTGLNLGSSVLYFSLDRDSFCFPFILSALDFEIHFNHPQINTETSMLVFSLICKDVISLQRAHKWALLAYWTAKESLMSTKCCWILYMLDKLISYSLWLFSMYHTSDQEIYNWTLAVLTSNPSKNITFLNIFFS